MAKVEQSIEINVPVKIAYRQLIQFEEYPRFMQGVHSVHQLDDAHLHWRAERGGKEMEWDAEIIEHIPEQCIAWRNTSGPKNEGKVTFEAMGPDKTRLWLAMEADDSVLHHPERRGDPHPQPDEDLARFKKMIESQQHSITPHRVIDEGGAIESDALFTPPAGAQLNAAMNTTRIAPQASPAPDAQQADSLSSRADTGLPDSSPATGPAHTYSADQVASTRQPNTRGAGMLPAPVQQVTGLMKQQARVMQQAMRFPVWMPGLLPVWGGEPFASWRKMSEEMESWFGHWSGTTDLRRDTPAKLRQADSAWVPAVDIEQQDEQLIICAELPGVKKEEVQVEIVDSQLTITGERQLRRDGAAQHHAERHNGRFYRALALPEGTDPDSARATMQDGVLEIRLRLPLSRRHARRLEILPAGS